MHRCRQLREGRSGDARNRTDTSRLPRGVARIKVDFHWRVQRWHPNYVPGDPDPGWVGLDLSVESAIMRRSGLPESVFLITLMRKATL